MDRRQEILSAAGGLFREHGYHATSMRDIAKRLNLRGSSLYAHVASKEEMLWEIVNSAADAFLAQAESVPPDLPPQERLERLIRGHLQVIIGALPNATVFFHEWKFLAEDLRAQIVARRDRYEQYFRQIIREGTEQGIFEVEDDKLATFFVLSALNWSYQWFDADGELTLAQLSQHYTTLVCRALNAKED